MKRYVLLIGVIISILFSLSCAKKDKKVLRVGYIPIAECVQLYVAKDMGLFEKYGVDVEIISLSGGAKILNALNTGNVDVGFSNVVSLILHKQKGSDLYSVFGGTYESEFFQNHALLVNGDMVKSVRDIKGKKVAVNTFKNIEELMVRKYLKSLGLSWNDVDKMEVDFPQMLPLLENGQIAVASVVEPFITIGLEDKDGVIKKISNHYITFSPNTLVATYVASKESIDSKKDAMRGFILAMRDATDYIKNNEAEARCIIGNYTKIPTKVLPRIGLSDFKKELDKNDLDSILVDMKEFNYVDKNYKLPENIKYQID
jgi:NitT/TauT family transport system substrate-binding protein